MTDQLEQMRNDLAEDRKRFAEQFGPFWTAMVREEVAYVTEGTEAEISACLLEMGLFRGAELVLETARNMRAETK